MNRNRKRLFSAGGLLVSLCAPLLLTSLGCQNAPPSAKATPAELLAAAELQQVTFEEEAPTPVAAPDTITLDPAPDPGELVRTTRILGLEQLSAEQRLDVDLHFIVQQALANSEVIRDPSQFLSPGNPLLKSPEQVASSLDPTIYAASSQGVEEALAAFDAQAAIGAQWGQNSLLQTNSTFAGAVTTPNVLVKDSGSIYGRLSRAVPSGGVVSMLHNWNYSPEVYPGTGFQTQHVSFLRTEVRQPLLAGRGREVTSAAGPASLNRGQLGRGVVVAQFEQEIANTELEAKLQLLVRQVQHAYWELWLAQQELVNLSASRDNAKELLDRVKARTTAGLPGGDAANEAQAEEVFLQRESAVNDAMAAVLEQAGRTRRLVGLPAADQRVLTAVQAPFDGEVILDWPASAAMAVQQRAELRQQEKQIEVLGMQLAAADNLTQPQLDLVAGAQLNGFGDEAIGANSGGVVNSLLSGDHVGWSVGLEFSTPLGLRSAHARRRYLSERLNKARAVANAQQQEVQHELKFSFHEVDRTFKNVQLAARRRAAALRRQRAADADFEAGRSSVDLVLRAQAAHAEAERSYVQSLVGYNKALVDLKYREGTLLAECCSN